MDIKGRSQVLTASARRNRVGPGFLIFTVLPASADGRVSSLSQSPTAVLTPRQVHGLTMAAPDGIDHVHRNKCIQEASTAGVKGAAFGIAVSAPLVYLAHRMSPRFASFTTSTKTGLIVTPFFGFFFLNSELAMNSCAQRRAEFAQAVPK